MGVTGCVAAYKAPDLIRALIKCNHKVKVMATDAALRFVTRDSLISASDEYVEEKDGVPVHINETDDLQVFLVAPCTANTITKFVVGLGDNLLSDCALALPKETIKILAPAMNTRMWENEIIQHYLKDLAQRGWNIIQPIEGDLACGTTGMGKFPPTREVVSKIEKIFKKQGCF